MKAAFCFILSFASTCAGLDLLAEIKNKQRDSVQVAEVLYHLYTRNTQDSPVIIRNNDVNALAPIFNLEKPSVFVVHGWKQNVKGRLNIPIRSTIFLKHDINLFMVDWSGPAGRSYPFAKSATVQVGKIIAAFINSIQAQYELDGSSFVLIGHSLGAHTVGVAGAAIPQQVEHIIGLDPSGPLYLLTSKSDRLDASDGKFVQVIHTNGAWLGTKSPMGHVDYYPNGGLRQPGCGFDFMGRCSHNRAVEYFSEALSEGDVFIGRMCSRYNLFKAGLCNTNPQSSMGLLLPKQRTSGNYYLTTNSVKPFGQS